MFTGIVREVGTVGELTRADGVSRLSVYAPQTAPRLQRLESVSVNGVCLSVVRLGRGSMTFELIPETRRLTALDRLRPGTRVNLEPSLSLSDRLGGQLLFGHVDGVGTIVKRRQLAGELVLEIRIRTELRKFLVPKGPVAVDGVSLTVGRRLTRTAFTVHLIPETVRQTTLSTRQVGERVNIELDYFAKLVAQFVKQGSVVG